MTLVTRASNASLDTSTAMYAPQVTGLVAGENLELLGPCYIKSSDGKVYKSNATANNEAAEFAGIAPRAALAGEPVTLYGLGTRFRIATGLTVGDLFYVGATAGRWDDGPTTGDQVGTLQAITSTDVVVTRSSPKGVLDGADVADLGITAAKLAADSVTTAKILDLNVTTGKLAAGAVTAAKAAVFVSAEQTGTGAPQNVAHGLGAVPSAVLVAPTEHPGVPDTGAFDIAEGAHDGTNVVVTVTTNVKFKVLAWA
jgi:hypothetical protein